MLTIGDGATGLGAFTGNLSVVWNQGPSSTTMGANWSNSGSVTLNATGSGSIALSGPVNNSGLVANSGSGTGSVTISSPIGPNVTGLMQNSGNSLLVLTNSNNSSGGIAISAGTLEINTTGSVNALGSGTLTMGNPANTGAAAAIQFNGNSSNFPTFANAINVTGNGADLIYATKWNPIFSGRLTLSNNLTIGSNNSAGSTLNFNGGVNGMGNITVSIDNTNNLSYVTFGAMAVNNSGTLTFNNASFNGGPAGTGNGTNTISGGVGSNVTAMTQGSNVNPLTINTNPLSVNGSGTTLISSGSALFTVSGGVNGTGNLALQNNSTAAAGITLSISAVNNAGTITNSGSGSGGATISAPILANVTGIVESSASSPLTLSGANSFTGNTRISSGTLSLGSSLALQDSVLDTSGAGTLASTVAALTFGGLTGETNLTLPGGVTTLTLNRGAGVSPTYGGALGSQTAGMSLTKSGSGIQVLAGNNTYTGATTVNQGGLVVNGSLVSPVTVNSGGTLGGTGYLGSVTVNPGGNLAPGDSLGTLSVSGSLILSSGAAMEYELDTPSTSSLILMPLGQLVLSGQQFADVTFTPTILFAPGIYPLIEAGSISGSLGASTTGSIDGYPATLAVQGNDVVLNVTPEPSTLTLLAAGAVALVGYGLRLRRTMRRTAKLTACDQQDDPSILSFPSHASGMANEARRAA